MKFQITVTILTYNSNYNDIKQTILSIINQKGITYEIIISDDGSKENHFKQIKKLFNDLSFDAYQLISHDTNNGTCINYYNAVMKANGEYIKPISPQDFLYDENTLLNWYNYMKEYNIDVSFGRAIYYEIKDDVVSFIQRKSTKPTLFSLYNIDHYKKKDILIDNLILNDCILGASYFCERKILLKYLLEIVGKIRLCEDFSYRLMLLDDIKVCFYDKLVVYYCFGTGVSSKKKKNGVSLLHEDEIEFRKIISKKSSNEKIKNRIINFLSHNYNNRYVNRVKSFIYFPKAIKLKLQSKIYIKAGKVKTSTNVNYKYLKSIGINI